MLNASPCVRKEMVKEVEILGDHMQSGYDKIHGEDGNLNAMALKVEYGDHQERKVPTTDTL